MKRKIREQGGVQNKLESKFQQNNMRDVWSGICGQEHQTYGNLDRPNVLNMFFNIFSSEQHSQ